MKKIKFLGTAAAEGFPAPFCSCRVCEMARQRGGRNLRTRAQCVIDEDMLVDLGPDTFMHHVVHQVDFRKLAYVFITHSHSDHYDPEILQHRHRWSSNCHYDTPLKVFGNGLVEEKLNQAYDLNDMDDSLAYIKLNLWEWHKEADVEVLPLRATHGRGEECFVYVLRRGGKTLLYGNDSGRFSEETWSHLIKYQYDCIIFDCTCGLEPDCGTHMNYTDNVNTKKRLMEAGCTHESTKFIISHFSHNSKIIYDDMVPVAERDGFLVAYDGLEIFLS